MCMAFGRVGGYLDGRQSFLIQLSTTAWCLLLSSHLLSLAKNNCPLAMSFYPLRLCHGTFTSPIFSSGILDCSLHSDFSSNSTIGEVVRNGQKPPSQLTSHNRGPLFSQLSHPNLTIYHLAKASFRSCSSPTSPYSLLPFTATSTFLHLRHTNAHPQQLQPWHVSPTNPAPPTRSTSSNCSDTPPGRTRSGPPSPGRTSP